MRFVTLGALIFAIHAVLVPRGAERRIDVSAADIERLREIAVKQWGREPGPEQMDALIHSFVREEVLYREGLASGLDRDDVIVRRRLAQKMEFLAQEDVRAPTDGELQVWFQAHARDYAQPETMRLEQVYFSRRTRGIAAEADAARGLAALRAGTSVRGDDFMRGAELGGQTRDTLAREFGDTFAEAVWTLPTGAWSGPIASAFGVHLVRVTGRSAARTAHLDEVRDRARADALNQRVLEAREQAYARARQRYTVRVDSANWRVSTAAAVERQPQ